VLLVITKEPAVAAWAEGPFGPARMQLHPVVFCLADMPQQLTMNEALENPVLAVLHALAHPRSSTAKFAFDAIKQFPDQLRELSFAMLINQREEYRGTVSVERLQLALMQVPYAQKVLAELFKDILEVSTQQRIENTVNIENEIKRAVEEAVEKEDRKRARRLVEYDIPRPVEEAPPEARKESLASLQDIAFALLRSKKVQMTAADEQGLREIDEAALTSLIVALGTGVEEGQLHAAVSRSLARST
jgi:hypothetical protein